MGNCWANQKRRQRPTSGVSCSRTITSTIAQITSQPDLANQWQGVRSRLVESTGRNAGAQDINGERARTWDEDALFWYYYTNHGTARQWKCWCKKNLPLRTAFTDLQGLSFERSSRLISQWMNIRKTWTGSTIRDKSLRTPSALEAERLILRNQVAEGNCWWTLRAREVGQQVSIKSMEQQLEKLSADYRGAEEPNFPRPILPVDVDYRQKTTALKRHRTHQKNLCKSSRQTEEHVFDVPYYASLEVQSNLLRTTCRNSTALQCNHWKETMSLHTKSHVGIYISSVLAVPTSGVTEPEVQIRKISLRGPLSWYRREWFSTQGLKYFEQTSGYRLWFARGDRLRSSKNQCDGAVVVILSLFGQIHDGHEWCRNCGR